ncbi:MAG TPA: CBASS cGAMP synthase [Pseudomonas sp.]|uniref:CBASS cGAMP synthase n=1 Tax=Pseudomonas sp. TaxID=306 RepID=UPI002B49AFE2|nr:CBASS cGAMP synthase [Pseudomonas sp.]HKS13241.1 CBASS cGAMP synthase [Pseudomonas sp.]
MPSLNLHSLLDTRVEGRVAFLDNLTLDPQERKLMLSARTDIRQRLKARLPKRIQKKAEDAGQGQIDVPEPRFFTQGSWAYKTLNAPCRAPQQADLDDGAYLPFSYIESQPPAQMSALLFEAVEEVLSELADDKGWEIDTSNDNCTRLVIDSDKHIDVPVYSISDSEFETLVKASMEMYRFGMESFALDSADSEERADEQDWDLMPTEGVLMATKNRGWQNSDPRPIRDWVVEQVELKGEQLRRVMRYLKAWRDFQKWDKDDPKSILLMVAADAAFDIAIDKRDDLALLKVLQRLPDILRGKVINPATTDKPLDEQEDLAKRLDNKGIREDVISRIEHFADQLEYAIDSCGVPSKACEILIELLGNRVPNDPERVTQSTVQSQPAQKTAAVPPLGKATAG